MSQAWIPRNHDEACRRHAGRRKMIARKREVRAERIERIIQAMLVDESLRAGTYGSTRWAAQAMGVGEATACRDLHLARGILNQFADDAGRDFDPSTDSLVWDPHYRSFSFQTTRPEDLGDEAFLFTTRSL